MTDSDILLEMIKEEALISLDEEHDKKKVVLIEDQVPDSKVTIKNVPPDALVIKVDLFPAPTPIFKNK